MSNLIFKWCGKLQNQIKLPFFFNVWQLRSQVMIQNEEKNILVSITLMKLT